ncbi:MAG: hypothetical protein AMXMBFR64_57670 [Myxococcales bacterium]
MTPLMDAPFCPGCGQIQAGSGSDGEPCPRCEYETCGAAWPTVRSLLNQQKRDTGWRDVDLSAVARLVQQALMTEGVRP